MNEDAMKLVRDAAVLLAVVNDKLSADATLIADGLVARCAAMENRLLEAYAFAVYWKELLGNSKSDSEVTSEEMRRN